MTLADRFRELFRGGGLDLPLPGAGATASRHQRLVELGRQDLSLARLAEAHVDAVAILAEAGRAPHKGALYGVWASETPGQSLRLSPGESGLLLSGAKAFCTGARIVDRALLTVRIPEHRLVDIDLRLHSDSIVFDGTQWIASAFAGTDTATATFTDVPVDRGDAIGEAGWYLDRPGFWHGACGPAACWTGGAIGLVDWARKRSTNDPHTMAHLGAMLAATWALRTYLDCAGREIDSSPGDRDAAMTRALTTRHLVEQVCEEVLHRFARAYGPRPLAFDAAASNRYHELDLYIRQFHGEHDLEQLGRLSTTAQAGVGLQANLRGSSLHR